MKCRGYIVYLKTLKTRQKMIVNSLKEVCLDTFKDAVYQAVTNKITSIAPLGYSSPTILLYGKDGNERRQGISIRNHSGTVSLLICDAAGSFIFHGGYDKRLPVDFIANEYFKIFKKVKKYITVALPSKKETYNEHIHYSSGFDILAMKQRDFLFHC